MDPEVKNHLDLSDQKHTALTHRVSRLEEVSQVLGQDIDELKTEFADHRVRLERQYGDIRTQLGSVVPEALASVPKEVYKAQKRDQDKATMRWVIITGIFTAIGAVAALMGYLVILSGK